MSKKAPEMESSEDDVTDIASARRTRASKDFSQRALDVVRAATASHDDDEDDPSE